MKWKTTSRLTLIGMMVLVVIAMNALAETSYPMCEDTVEVTTNCTMVTPDVVCDVYDYNISNQSGDHVKEQQEMVVFNDNSYFFNFTEGRGQYHVTICNGATRDVIVEEDESKMIVLATLILLPLFIAGLLFFVSSKLGDKQWFISTGMLLFGFMLILVSWLTGLGVLAKYYDFPELQSILGDNIYGWGMFIVLLIIYFGAMLIVLAVKWMQNKKQKKVGFYDDESEG